MNRSRPRPGGLPRLSWSSLSLSAARKSKSRIWWFLAAGSLVFLLLLASVAVVQLKSGGTTAGGLQHEGDDEVSQTVYRHDPQFGNGRRNAAREHMGTTRNSESKDRREGSARTLKKSTIREDLQRALEKKKKSPFIWSHALGMKKKTFRKLDKSAVAAAGCVSCSNPDDATAQAALHQLRGFKELVGMLKEQEYNSDDEPEDVNVQQNLAEVLEIEDTFQKPVKKANGMYISIPMLQDPDTLPGSWMTKSDKAVLRAMRSNGYGRGFDVSNSTVWPHSSKTTEDEAARISELGVGSQEKEINNNGNKKQQWGFFQGFLKPSYSFSQFMDRFLHQEVCAQRVFMAWTTPASSFTIRHQCALETLLHFHPNACIVVFSESIEFNFFETFIEERYKVAVVRPNLEELLAGTPTLEFASMLSEWRKTKLFYIHYTELLRLAAIYKYGGVYLDMDVILSKPLHTLHNTVGSDFSEGDVIHLNGAFMFFSRSSPFLRECLKEFAATYDNKSLVWNGAELLTRVANRTIKEDGTRRWQDEPQLLDIQPPFSFFPLSASNISRYYIQPVDRQQQEEQEELLSKIHLESYGTHLWNGLTAQLIPEHGSLVHTILNQHCVHASGV